MTGILFYFLAIPSLLVSIIGIVNDKYWLLLIGAVLIFPFSYSLSSAMDFGGFILLPLFYLGSAVAVYQNKKSVAWLMLLPVFLLALFVLTLVLIFTLE
jgi:hypothetical protein